MDPESPQPRPATFKTRADGRGGLVRVTLVGGPHAGHELYIDELDLPDEIWTTPAGRRFEWWGPGVRTDVAQMTVGSDPAAPLAHYALRIPEDTAEPQLVADDPVGHLVRGRSDADATPRPPDREGDPS